MEPANGINKDVCDAKLLPMTVLDYPVDSGPAAPVLAGPVFLKVKNKLPFLQIVSTKQKF